MLVSFFRCTVRSKFIPHVSLSGLKFSVRNGISTSTVHPISLRWTRSVQTPSHARFWPFDTHERVGHVAERIRLEEVAGAGVEEGVDGPPDLVVRGKPLVPPALVGDPPVRLGVVRGHADVQRRAIVGDADFGLFRRRAAVVRVDLDEVAGGHGPAPHRLVEPAVEVDPFVGFHPRRPEWFAVRRCRWQAACCPASARSSTAEDEGEETRKPRDLAARNDHEADASP